MSIRKLTEADHPDVVDFFGDQIGHYYFIINELLSNHYSADNLHVFGEYEEGLLVSVLINNNSNVTYLANTDRAIEGYKGVLKRLKFSKLSGPSKWMGKFIPLLEVKQDSLSHMGVVKKISVAKRYPEFEVSWVQSEEELSNLYDLLLEGGYAGSISKQKTDFIRNGIQRIEEKSERTAYLNVDGKMVSSAAAVREGEKSAIIVGVVTHPVYRGLGYGTEVLIGLFDRLLQEGKYPYLFYDNPAARSVYKKLGMTEVCEWRVLYV